jgi:hypothetical protein
VMPAQAASVIPAQAVSVIPAQAGIQGFGTKKGRDCGPGPNALGSRLRGNDDYTFMIATERTLQYASSDSGPPSEP